jgi:UDP-glucose 4-epimerase
MRILVTGGAGFIGSHLVDGFLREGHSVEVIDNLSSGNRDNLPASVPLNAMDIQSDECGKVFERFRPEVLCHHAAQLDVFKSMADPMFDANVNIVASLRLFEQCRRHGTRRILFASSAAIYGAQTAYPAPETHPDRPVSPYGVAKLTVEHYLRFYQLQYGLQPTSLRYANVYGPRQSTVGEAGVVAIFAKLLRSGKAPTIYGNGEQTRDFVYVGDIVAANLAALNEGLIGTYNVSTGIETTVNGLYALMAQSFGSSLSAAHGPERAGEMPRSSLDSSKLAQASSWRPQTRVAEGVQRTCDFFKAHHSQATSG